VRHPGRCYSVLSRGDRVESGSTIRPCIRRHVVVSARCAGFWAVIGICVLRRQGLCTLLESADVSANGHHSAAVATGTTRVIPAALWGDVTSGPQPTKAAPSTTRRNPKFLEGMRLARLHWGFSPCGAVHYTTRCPGVPNDLQIGCGPLSPRPRMDGRSFGSSAPGRSKSQPRAGPTGPRRVNPGVALED
jgi:hypothetical protein